MSSPMFKSLFCVALLAAGAAHADGERAVFFAEPKDGAVVGSEFKDARSSITVTVK